MRDPKNKYNRSAPEQRTYQGRLYDSKAEMHQAVELDERVEAGEILWWLPQVKVWLGADFSTRIDFLVCPIDDFPHGVEVKGALTDRWGIIRRLWKKYGPFPLHVKRNGKLTETLHCEAVTAVAEAAKERHS